MVTFSRSLFTFINKSIFISQHLANFGARITKLSLIFSDLDDARVHVIIFLGG